jgi:hypothetical protein
MHHWPLPVRQLAVGDRVDRMPLPLDEQIEVRPRPRMQIGGRVVPESSPRSEPGDRLACPPVDVLVAEQQPASPTRTPRIFDAMILPLPLGRR